ncbi:hypothetical protein HGA92_03475 [Candidatus Gracilibacteria bacterium]|nr:hypothetical protein [Candidatus Gracilibacteria bacterium]NUJ99158.1 hypothetical protein [Candidatus Gracilibacteria bacterium]
MAKLISPIILLLIIIVSIITGEFYFGMIIFLVFLFLSVKIVTPNTVKTVEFLGRFNRILRPGLNLLIPILEITKSQVLFRKNFPVEVEGVTSDNVTAYIGLNVIYYVNDDGDDTQNGSIYRSIYSIDDPKTMMKSTIDEQLRAMIVSFDHKEIFGKREEIGETIEERLRQRLDGFGYKLDSIQVRDVKLENSVMMAMNKVVETQKLKEAAMNEGESKKIMQVKQAEAEKESKILLGEGMAGQRMKIAEGFKESVDLIKASDNKLDGEKILRFLLDSSRIETLGNIGSSDKTKLIYLNESLEGYSKTDKLVAGSDLMK